MKKLTYAALFALITVTANAQVVYTNRTVYDTAHPNNFVIDFDNATPGPFQYADFTAPSPRGNITFDAIPSSNNIEFVGNNVFPFVGANNLVLYAFNGQFLTDSLLVSLPANTFSFGLDVISPSGTVPEPYQFTIYSGSTVLATLASPSVNTAYTFFGYDSATSSITSVAIQIANGIGSPVPVIDNFTVVPEPSTWFGAGSCLLFVVYSSLRKRSRVAPSD
jgi:hypothetical protein